MTTPFRTAASTVMVGLFASLLAIVPTTSSNAEQAPAASKPAASGLVPGNPMPGEKVSWTGKTKTTKAKVTLQVAKGRKWRKVATVRTDKKGRFAAPITGAKSPSTAKYRLVRGTKTLATRKVVTVAQTSTLSAPVDTGRNQVEVTATFVPARQGRRAALLSLVDGQWMGGQTGTQDANGQVTFAITLAATGSTDYRAAGFPYKGSADVFTNTQTVTRPTTPTANPTPTATPTAEPTTSPTATPTAEPTPDPNGPPEVAALDSNAADSLGFYDATTGTMRFDGSAPASIRAATPGTIIAVPITAATPDGALREVVSVTTNPDGSTTVQTTDGVLAEAVATTPGAARNVDFQHVSTQVVALADGVSIAPQPEVYSSQRMPQRLIPEFAPSTFDDEDYDESTIEVEVKDFNKDLGDGARLEVRGKVAVTPKAVLDLNLDPDFDWLESSILVKNYNIGAGAEVENDLTVHLVKDLVQKRLDVKKEWALADMNHKFLSAIGAVPVVITVNHKFFLELTVEGEIGVRAKVTYKGRAIAGVKSTAEYDPNPDFYGEMPDGETSLRVGAFGKAEMFAGASFAVNLYGAAGPQLQVGVLGTAEGELGFPVEFTDEFSWRSIDWSGLGTCKAQMMPAVRMSMKLSDSIEKLIGQEVGIGTTVMPKDPWWGFTCPDPDDVPVIDNFWLSDGVTRRPYSNALSIKGDRAGDWSVQGHLPPGLALRNGDADEIYGRPTYPGTYEFGLKFVDDVGRETTQDYTITITGDPVDPMPGDVNWLDIADTIHDATLSAPYSTTLGLERTSTYGSWDQSYQLASGKLPPGLDLRPIINNAGGVIAGTPTSAGLYAFTIKAVIADARGRVIASGYRSFIMSVIDGTVPDDGDPDTYGVVEAVEGQPVSAYLDPNHFDPFWGYPWPSIDTPVHWEVLGGNAPESLEAEEVYDWRTDTYSWRLMSSVPLDAGGYWLTMGAWDARGNKSTVPFHLTVKPNRDAGDSVRPPRFLRSVVDEERPEFMPENVAWRGRSYSALLLNNNRFVDEVEWTVVSGALPPGLRIVSEVGGYARISGTPSAVGTYEFVLRAGLVGSEAGHSQRFIFTVVDGTAQPSDPGVAVEVAVNDWSNLGTHIDWPLPTPGDGIRWTLAGRLPRGLSLMQRQPGEYSITGGVRMAGTYTFTLVGAAADADMGSSWYDERTYTITATPPG